MEKLLLPFYKISLFLLKLIPLERLGGRVRKTEEKLNTLLYGKDRIPVREYYARNLAAALCIVFWGMGLVLLIQIIQDVENQDAVKESLVRPSYGEGNGETELEAYIEGETEKTVLPVSISEQSYTVREIQEIFAEITTGLDTSILGENESLEEVRQDLNLPSSVQNGAVAIEWVLDPSDVLDDTGKRLKEVPEQGELVELRALIRYRDQEAEYTTYAHVYPPVRTRQEQLLADLQKEVSQADEDGIYENKLALPKEVKGKKVEWSVPKESTAPLLAGVVLLGAAAVYLNKDKRLDKMSRLREKQLLLDYSEVLLKMSMLIGAGMTIKGAFQKIAGEYERRTGNSAFQKGKNLRYVYEEMRITCHEMENGVGEARAYENFGRRCGESRYIKLGSVLAQNLKKGAKGLQEYLESEAAAGLEERKNIARKMGEEAGTKLLIPMMLMLLLVLVILMVPAMMNF